MMIYFQFKSYIILFFFKYIVDMFFKLKCIKYFSCGLNFHLKIHHIYVSVARL